MLPTTPPPLRRRRGRLWWLSRSLPVGLIVLLLLAALLRYLEQAAGSKLAQQYPAPGQLVDMDGYRMHILCRGEGRPTVILEAGASDFSLQWTLVQPQVATFTRVCVYDRAGFGWSDPSPYRRTSDVIVEELHRLLTRAEIPGPYVMVGHSFGGMNVRLYAHRYPEEVAGMVLLDALHEAQFLGSPGFLRVAKMILALFHNFPLLRSPGLLALFPDQIPVRGLTGEAADEYRAILATTRYLATAIEETESLEESLALVRAAQLAGLGNIPLIVVSRQVAFPLPGAPPAVSEHFEQEWQLLQLDLVALSPNSKHVIAEGSGHHIQLARPDIVVEAIREVVFTLREQQAMRRP